MCARLCVRTKRFDIRNWLIQVIEAGMSQDLQSGPKNWRLGRNNVPARVWRPSALEPGWANGTDEVQRQSVGTFSLAWGEGWVEAGFFLLLFFSDIQVIGRRHPRRHAEGNLLYSKFTDLKDHLIHKQSHTDTQKNVRPNIWELCGPAKLPYKVNHHKNVLKQF